MATAVFGPERGDYWRRSLSIAQEAAGQPEVNGRVKELEDEILDLERRMDQQILSLEAEEATPVLRKRVAQRLAELDGAMAERRLQLEQLVAQALPEAPKFADVEVYLTS